MPYKVTKDNPEQPEGSLSEVSDYNGKTYHRSDRRKYGGNELFTKLKSNTTK